jgi:hypothetical protein
MGLKKRPHSAGERSTPPRRKFLKQLLTWATAATTLTSLTINIRDLVFPTRTNAPGERPEPRPTKIPPSTASQTSTTIVPGAGTLGVAGHAASLTVTNSSARLNRRP